MKTAVVIATVVYQCVISQYSPGIMEEVIWNRQYRERSLSLSLPQVDGFVAVRDCEDIGAVLWLRPEGQEEWERFLSVDCAHSEEVRAWMDGENPWDLPVGAEVDYATALRWDTVGEMQVGEVMVLEHRLVPISEARPPYLVE